MGKRPLPLWTYGKRSGIDDEPALPRPLAGDWRDEFALVYEAAGTRGLSLRECDELEIWVLAAALGANRPDDSDPLAGTDGYSWNERRAIALERGEPEPSWDDVPMSAREIADMERLMANAPVGMLPPEGDPAS